MTGFARSVDEGRYVRKSPHWRVGGQRKGKRYMKMKQTKRLAIVAILAATLSGCGVTGDAINEQDHATSMALMRSQGQTTKLIEYFHTHLTYETADLRAILQLCSTYLEFADYEKTRNCLDHYSIRLAGRRSDPDDAINETSEERAARFVLSAVPLVDLFVNTDSLSESYENLMTHMLWNEAHYEIVIGNPKKAIDHMEKAYELMKNDPAIFRASDFSSYLSDKTT